MRTLATVGAVIAALSYASAADAASKVSVRPSKVTGRVLTFKLKTPARKVGIAHVRLGAKRDRLRTGRVRKAAARGRLTYKAPRAVEAPLKHATLTYTVTQPGAPVTAPAPVKGPATDVAIDPIVVPETPKLPAEPCALGQFAAGAWPGACWRPYSDDSPFNTPIPNGARIADKSGAIVKRFTGWGPPQSMPAGTADTADDWSHPVYFSSPSDPEYTIHCFEPWGKCSIEGMKVRIPSKARPAAGGDAHLTVVDQSTGWEYDLWAVRSKPSGGGVIETGWGGRTRIDGDGLNSDGTAARFGGLAGIIRAEELREGRIDHALFMIAQCDNGKFVFPASKNGRRCSVIGQSEADAPPMGSRLQLDMTPAEIDALRVPRWKKTVLRAMAEYGMFLGDTGGKSWGVQFESGSSYTSFGAKDPFVEIAKDSGAQFWDGVAWLNMADGVDWDAKLKVIAPCVTEKTC